MSKNKITMRNFIDSLLIIISFLIFVDLVFMLSEIAKFVNPDSLHWLFSTSAQSLAALIAFLIAGYAFTHNTLSQEKDETLIEINNEIKGKYFLLLKWILLFALIGILGDLLSIALIKNKFYFNFFNIIYSLTFISNVLAIILTIIFILYIMDPKRISKTAKEIYKKTDFIKSDEKVDYSKFLMNVVNFEKLLKGILVNKKLIKKGISITIKNMLVILLRNELIDKNLADKLDLIRRYRNIAVHGGVEKVDKGMGDLVESTIKNLKEKFNVN